MSANLLAGVEPTIPYNGQYSTVSDGVVTSSARPGVWYDVVQWKLPTTQTLAENQTMHLGISAKWHGAAATTGAAWASVMYVDAAGNVNYADIKISGITTEWQRFSLSAVVPSGMHIVNFHLSAQYLDAAYDAMSPVLSYGSPVTLASGAHTPYATHDHVAAEYATKAALKVTSDALAGKADATHTHAIADVDGLQAALDSKANAATAQSAAAAVTPIANGGTGATTKDGARKNLGIATVADVAWTDLWKDTDGNYVRWACRNNVVYVKWKIPQTTTNQWRAGFLPAGYLPSGGTVAVAAWTEGNRMATAWVDGSGGVLFKVNSAQTDGTNQGSLSYPIF